MATIFFDLDGTIIDPKQGMVSSFRSALDLIGRSELIADDLGWIIGPSIASSFARILNNPSEAGRALALYRENYVDRGAMFHFTTYPGIVEVIQTLAATHELHILTMKPRPFAEPIVARLGIGQWIGKLFGPELNDDTTSKDPLLEMALHRTQSSASDCLLIGDRGTDIAAARAHQVTPVGVTWGYGAVQELVEAGADRLCDSPNQIPEAIAQWTSEMIAPRDAPRT